MRLTDQHHRFATHYIATGSPRAAYIAAGFSEKSARQNAHKLLKRPDIRKLVDDLKSIDRARTSHQLIVAGAAKGALVHAEHEDAPQGLGQVLNRIGTIKDLQRLVRISMGEETVLVTVSQKNPKTGKVEMIETKTTVIDLPTAHKALVTLLEENERFDKLNGPPSERHKSAFESAGKKLGDLLDIEREAARRRLQGF